MAMLQAHKSRPEQNLACTELFKFYKERAFKEKKIEYVHLSLSPALDCVTIVSSQSSWTVRAKLTFSASIALQKSLRIVSPWVKSKRVRT